MKTLVNYIEKGLQRNDFLVVPGIGGFISHPLSAGFSEEKGILCYLPPRKEVCFNPSLKYDSGVIQEMYAAESGLSSHDARSKMEKEIVQLQTFLSENRKIMIGDFGVLELTDENAYSFTASADKLLYGRYYGLNEIKLNKAEVRGVSHKQNDGYLHININKKTFYGAVISTVAAIFLLSFFMPFELGNEGVNSASFSPIELCRSLPSHEVQKVEPASTSPIEESTIGAPKEQVTVSVKSTKKYYVIVSSTTSSKDADLICKKIKNQGFDECGIIEEQGRFRVYADVFEERPTAESSLTKIRENHKEFHSAWLYIKKDSN